MAHESAYSIGKQPECSILCKGRQVKRQCHRDAAAVHCCDAVFSGDAADGCHRCCDHEKYGSQVLPNAWQPGGATLLCTTMHTPGTHRPHSTCHLTALNQKFQFCVMFSVPATPLPQPCPSHQSIPCRPGCS